MTPATLRRLMRAESPALPPEYEEPRRLQIALLASPDLVVDPSAADAFRRRIRSAFWSTLAAALPPESEGDPT